MQSPLGPTCLGLCASWTCMSISFTRLGKFSFIICSNKFSISCSSSSPSGTPMIQMLVHLKLSHRFLNLSLVFWILVFSFCSDWLFISSCCSKSLIWIPASFPSLLVPCRFFFISLCNFHFFLYFLPYSMSSLSILITSVLNSASDRLAVSILLNSFAGLLFCSLIWAIFLHLFILAASLCLCLCIRYSCFDSLSWCTLCKRQNFRAVQPTLLLLWHCMWEIGWRGNSATCFTFAPFPVTSPTSWMHLVPFWLLPWCWISEWMGLQIFYDCGSPLNGLFWETSSFFHHSNPHWFLHPEVMTV